MIIHPDSNAQMAQREMIAQVTAIDFVPEGAVDLVDRYLVAYNEGESMLEPAS
jgi:hypothetical protein